MTDINQTPFVPQTAGGDAPSTPQFNGLVRSIVAALPAIQPGRQVRPPRAPTPPVIEYEERQFQLVGIFGDYLTAYYINEKTGTADTAELFYIAKPYLLRNYTSRGSRTYSTFTNEDELQERLNVTDSETQVVVPTYTVGDLLYARRGIKGGTSVTYVDSNGATQYCQWLDDGQGRSWAKKKE